MFNPSPKQIQAILNMENSLWIRNHRVIFESSAEFQDYFELLSKKIKKNKNLKNAIENWKITQEEIRIKVKNKKERFFSNYDNLRNSGVLYINKYFPTKWQFLDYLNKKTEDKEIIERVFSDISPFINEEILADSIIKILTEWWKNISYIQNKLITKKFDKNLINSKISELKLKETILVDYLVEDKIRNYKNKWKSKLWIRSSLIERREDEEIVDKILDKVFWIDGENETIINEIEKLKSRWITNNQEIIKKLLTKWFKYQDIKNNL